MTFFSLPVMAICQIQHITTGSIVVVLRLPWTLLSPSTLTRQLFAYLFIIKWQWVNTKLGI